MEVCVLANFSKTAERNKTLFTGIQVRLKLSSNQQTDQKSVHSTRRYSNIKVPYQMTKSPKYGSCFASRRVNGVNGWCHPLLGLKIRASLLANFSKTAEQKQTPLGQLVVLLEIRVILKNEPNRCILQEVIAKKRYRTN